MTKFIYATLIISAAIFSVSPAVASSAISCTYKAKSGERIITRDVQKMVGGKQITEKRCFLVRIQKPMPKSFTRGPTVHNFGFEKSHWNR